MTQIGIIGNGNVGSALEKGLTEAGHEVRSIGNEPDEVRAVARWAEQVVLAVPFTEREAALREMGDAVNGKVVIDVTNAVGESGFAGSTDKSGAEALQEAHEDITVVKAFNTVFAAHMAKGEASGQTLSLFVAGDDEAARRVVMELGEQIGFDPVDAGPLENARWLEALGYLNITLGYKMGHGGETGFRYVHPQRPEQRGRAVEAEAAE